jgi:hypothetical protein
MQRIRGVTYTTLLVKVHAAPIKVRVATRLNRALDRVRCVLLNVYISRTTHVSM